MANNLSNEEQTRGRNRSEHAAELAAAPHFPVKLFGKPSWEPTPYVGQPQCVLSIEASDLDGYLNKRGGDWFRRGIRLVVAGQNADVVWECHTVERNDEGEILVAAYYPTPTSLEILRSIRPNHHWRLEIFND